MRLFRSFFVARFAQNNFLTELRSTISVLHISFATLLHHLHFVQFCLQSEPRLSLEGFLQWCKPSVDIFPSSRNWVTNIGVNLKKALFSEGGSINTQILGVVVAVRVVINHSKFTLIVFFCFYSNLFALRFHFYAHLKLQLNWDFTMLLFSGP